MACTLSNKCAKNLSKRTVLLQLIIKNVVTCFFGTQCGVELTRDPAIADQARASNDTSARITRNDYYNYR